MHSPLQVYIKGSAKAIKIPTNNSYSRRTLNISGEHYSTGVPAATVGITKLANSDQSSLEPNESVARVRALYEALGSKDVDTVHRVLAPDLEWWFHGPPSHQYLMRLLTGASSSSSFVFAPISVVAFGPTVLAEGYDTKRGVSWVHAWTLTDGVITRVKEYFNTSVTVKRFATAASPSSAAANCQSVWQSKVCGESVPGLVLAI